MDTDARLKQIETIAQNARTTWFALLALLVFVGVTLMGHRDSDFFAPGAATRLPLVGLDVPPTAFFVAAPILTASVFCYLHVYLLGLWEALGRTTQAAQVQAAPLSDRVFPMLFTGAALWYRNRVRGDGAFRERALGRWTLTIAVLMGWGFGWLVLALVWWRSMPLHSEWLTLLIGLTLWIALFFGAHGLWAADRYLRDPDYQHIRHWSWREFAATTALLLAISAIGWLRTAGGLEDVWERSYAAEWTGLGPPLTSGQAAGLVPLARARMAEARLTARPADWKPFALWLRDYRRETGGDAGEAPPVPTPGEMERYRLWIEGLERPLLQFRDLRGAILKDAFLPGADLRDTDLRGADLTRAEMQGAVLWNAQMQGTVLFEAQMQGADLGHARMRVADLRHAQMQGADLGRADLQSARLDGAQMQAADLSGAEMQQASLADTQMQQADLSEAQMAGANLRGAQMQDADLQYADMPGSDLAGSKMRGADLRYANMTGAHLRWAEMQGADLRGAPMGGADLRQAEMQGADLRGALMWGADLRHAFTQDAYCTGTALVAALVHGADVACSRGPPSQYQLALTVGDTSTKLPEGIWVLSCLDRESAEVQASMAAIEPAIAHHPEEGNPDRVGRTEFEELLWCDADHDDPLRRRMHRISNGAVLD